MSDLARWGFAIGVGLFAGAVTWLVWPLPGLVWRAFWRAVRRAS